MSRKERSNIKLFTKTAIRNSNLGQTWVLFLAKRIKFTMIAVLIIALYFSDLTAQENDQIDDLKHVVETFRTAIIDPGRESEFYDLFLDDSITWATVYEGKTKETLLSNNRLAPFIKSTFKDFYAWVKKGNYEEKFYNVDINSDKNYANIKFDYTFQDEKEIKNWGREYWTLLNVSGQWKITSVLWTTNLQDIEKCPFAKTQQSNNYSNASDTTFDRKIFDISDNYVRLMMDSLEIVGLNYVVLINGKVIHKKAMGLANIENQVPMTLNNLFAVASISKLFSSTAVHSLLKSQNRSVDDTVGEFLPKRKDLPDSWKKLTLRQLLSHTSGIPDQIDYQIYLAPESDEFVIEALRDKPFSSKPGDVTRYNATGFMLVRMIIEELAGQDFETHMQENYFDKFNLTRASYGGFKKVVLNRVTSYRMVDGNLEMFPLAYSPTMYAAAGINITMNELILWIQAVLEEKIVSKEHLAAIWAPTKLNDGTVGFFGLGWETYELENEIWFTGHGGAGISSIRHYWKEDSPNTVTVILLSNGARNWVQMPDDVNMGIASYFMPGLLK